LGTVQVGLNEGIQPREYNQLKRRSQQINKIAAFMVSFGASGIMQELPSAAIELRIYYNSNIKFL
jgi:hypothetical protein